MKHEQSSGQISTAQSTSVAPQNVQAQMAQQPPVPTAQPENRKEQVVAVRKNGDGDIVQLKLSSGRIVDYKTAQAMVKNNEIANLNVFRGRDNEEHLRSNPDGREDNNLDNLPTF